MKSRRLHVTLNAIVDAWAKCQAGCCHAFEEHCPHFVKAEGLRDAHRYRELEALCFLCRREALTKRYELEEIYTDTETGGNGGG